MSKRPLDPFGLSLLDVLSNALGASILLMLLVAVRIGAGMQELHDVPIEEGEGERLTELSFKTRAKEDRSTIAIVQIRLVGSCSRNDILSLSPPTPHITIAQSVRDSSQWLIFKTDDNKLDIDVVLTTHGIAPSEVYVFATVDDLPLPKYHGDIVPTGGNQYKLFHFDETNSPKYFSEP